jgi:TRAP-type mannitol/chloroaromatic compound transport system permease small subunit
LIDLLGALLFLLPVCIVIGWASVPYVAQSWVSLEGSRETSGIPAVFVLKSFILLFVVLIALQGVSLLLHSILILTGAEAPEPEKPEPS